MDARKQTGILIILLLVIFTVYGQVIRHDFIALDDHAYVTENPMTLKGFSHEGVRWAFTKFWDGNWFPLTWLSIMADVQLFGTNAGPHHIMNVLYHALNTLLLFFFLSHMSGRPQPSLFIAALFALHPLHVESVAWVAERKDILSGTFWMATCLAYSHYVRKPGFWRYAAVFLLFAAGLMTKSMLVTLPVILLALDYWPLERLKNKRNFWTLIKEKLPLLGLSALLAVITFAAQSSRGWVSSLETVPLPVRLANAALSYGLYLKKMVLPTDLAIFYPYDLTKTLFVKGALSLCVLLAITVWVLRQRKQYPFLIVGWLWYLASLLPVIGLITIGSQSMADRYTYLPMIGILIMVAWGIPAFAARFSSGIRWVHVSAILALVFSAIFSWFQVGYWKNTATLFTHALEVTRNNYVAHENLAEFYANRGELDRAVNHYEQAIKVHPDPKVLNNLANTYRKLDKRETAFRLYSQAVSIDPQFPTGWSNMGLLSMEADDMTKAENYYVTALQIDPDFLPALSGLGTVLIREKRFREAGYLLNRALKIAPDDQHLQELLEEIRLSLKSGTSAHE